MSLEQVLEKLTDALNRNTDASLKLLDAQFGAGSTTSKNKTVTASSEPIETTETTEEKPAPKKKAAKKKAAPVEEKPEETEPSDPEIGEDETESTATMDDVRAAAIELRDAVSKDALEKVKKTFKIKGVKDLGEENYATFVRHCADVISQNEDV